MYCVDGGSGECVSYGILLAWQVSKRTVEFGDGGEMTSLAERPCISLSCEGVYKGHVVRLNGEGGAFEKMTEVANGLVNGEQFSIESRIVPFGLLQSTAEKNPGDATVLRRPVQGQLR